MTSRVISMGTFRQEDPTILSCAECGKQLYRATSATFNREACEKAGRDHEQECPKRKEAPC
jgi:hypothetical protein